MGFEINTPFEDLQKRSLFLATPCYGGFTSMTYMRSIADLTAMFAIRGIKLQLYMLSNESLITRARAYCLAHKNKIITEDGEKTIRWIVENKYSGKVLSLNDEGKFVWNKILRHWARPNLEKKQWVHLRQYKNKGSDNRSGRLGILCTSDHQCAAIKNPLEPIIEYVAAEKMKGLFSVRKPKKYASWGKTENPLYNKQQLAVIVGTVLGDGYIGTNGGIQINHGEKQGDYCRHKAELLNGSFVERLDVKKDFAARGFKKSQYKMFRMNVPSNAQTKMLRDMFYINGKKTPKNILSLIDEISLAFWYMDDGCYLDGKSNGSRPSMILCTQGFDLEDHKLLKGWFQQRWNLDPKISEGKGKYFLHFSHEDSKKFWRLVARYVHPTMHYKLPSEFVVNDKHDFDNKNLDYTAVLIADVHFRPDVHSKLYDIEVEKDHNFIANGTVVHNCADEFMRSPATNLLFIDADICFNPYDIMAMFAAQTEDSPYDVIGGPYPKKCISYEKIVTAVNKGWGDLNDPIPEKRDPNSLERFVGDYVFNPKLGPGQQGFAVNAPVEVLEVGTGYMMIKRSVFDKFKAAFPEYSYRPDHVRSEHFDGRREIMMYFQAEIDRYNPEKLYRQVLEEAKTKTSMEEVSKFIDETFKKVEEESAKKSKRYLSEDYFFSQKVQELGCKIWLWPWVKAQHYGSYNFGGSLVDLAAIGAAATANSQQLAEIKERAKKVA